MTVTLVLGGARSGKSRHAESLAHGRKVYVATAEAFDIEMGERIARHRSLRGAGWETVEAPLELVSALSHLVMAGLVPAISISPDPDGRDKPGHDELKGRIGADFVLIDCITVWLGNLLHHGRDIGSEVAGLCEALKSAGPDIVIVSNEVGLSIVPENAMARQFRDEQGLANQRLAEVADRVVFVAAGLPLRLK